LKIDGSYFVSASFNTLNRYGMFAEHCFHYRIMKFDDVSFEYAVAIMYGITFETSFEILYQERHGVAATVEALALYALV